MEDREIAGLVASGLAYGRVALILRSIERVLGVLGSNPAEYLREADPGRVRQELSDFRHRFTPGDQVADLLFSASRVQSEYGLLGNYLAGFLKRDSYLRALDGFSLGLLGDSSRNYLLPRPSLGSACKRLHLFMRWMVRKDDVDPGGWEMVPVSELIVPVDVHMFRVGRCLGFTRRKSADGRTALEITEGFRRLSPDDPVKYDFALTRFGIQNLTDCSLFDELFS